MGVGVGGRGVGLGVGLGVGVGEGEGVGVGVGVSKHTQSISFIHLMFLQKAMKHIGTQSMLPGGQTLWQSRSPAQEVLHIP
jgi:hypothetical protein